jgi:kumamolisin
MLRSTTIRAGVTVLALILSACSGGGGSRVMPSTAQPALPPSGSLDYGSQELKGATLGGKVSFGTVHFEALVRPSNAAGLMAYAQAVNNPASAQYREFLSASQIGARFGATQANYNAAAAYFRSFGLAVGGWPQRLTLSVAGKQADVERAFNTAFGVYSAAGGKLIGPMTPPTLPSTVPVVAVSLVKDLRASAQYRALVPVGSGQGNNFALGYTPQQIASAFDYTGAYRAGYTGAGIKLGIIGTGPIDPNDRVVYEEQFDWPNNILGRAGTGQLIQVDVTSAAAANTTPIGTGSPTATPPPVTGPCATELPACNPEDGEAQLDTEQALLAPDANTLFYLAYVPDECGSPSVSNCAPDPSTGYGYAYIGIDESDDEIEQAIADNTGGNNGPDVLSLSYGGAEVQNTGYFEISGSYSTSSFGVMEFASLAAEGVAVFISSGDAGAQGCARPLVPTMANDQCVSWPAVSPNVVSVGGVTTPLNQAGQFIGPLTGWGFQTNGGSGGSGGGVSSYIPLPTFQTGTGIIGSMRNQPDIALEADDITGVATIVNSDFGYDGSGAYGGTSVSAPEAAAMWSLVLSACKATPSCQKNGTYRLGNPAPLFYAIYNGTSPYTGTTYPYTFYDVTFGNNGTIPCKVNPSQVGPCPNPVPTPDPGYNAGVGYDQVTGIGVPFAGHLINTIVNPATPVN